MSYPELLAKTRELVAAAQTMGVLGAELRLRQMGHDGHPLVRSALQAVLRNLEPSLLDGLEPGHAAAIIGQLIYGLQDALNLIREPERAPGWSYTDPDVLQERGRGSRAVARNFANLARQRLALAALLRDCRFLDIGTGVGWLAIEVAKTWPGMRIVGLDICDDRYGWPQPMSPLRAYKIRFILRQENVTEINDEAAFDLSGCPRVCLARLSTAPCPDRPSACAGWLSFVWDICITPQSTQPISLNS